VENKIPYIQYPLRNSKILLPDKAEMGRRGGDLLAGYGMKWKEAMIRDRRGGIYFGLTDGRKGWMDGNERKVK
jgi:hypothetical protein